MCWYFDLEGVHPDLSHNPWGVSPPLICSTPPRPATIPMHHKAMNNESIKGVDACAADHIDICSATAPCNYKNESNTAHGITLITRGSLNNLMWANEARFSLRRLESEWVRKQNPRVWKATLKHMIGSPNNPIEPIRPKIICYMPPEHSRVYMFSLQRLRWSRLFPFRGSHVSMQCGSAVHHGTIGQLHAV